MWITLEDINGSIVCVNFATGMRFRANKDTPGGLDNGVDIVFPNGHSIGVRCSFDALAKAVKSSAVRT